MRCPALLLLPLLAAVLLHAPAAAGGGNGSCVRSCGRMTLPYPFGFSSGCTVRLGCHVGADGVGAAWLGGAPELGLLVRNVTPRALTLNLQPDCDRSFNASVAALFSDSYAPSSRNGLVVRNCSSSEADRIRNCSSDYINRTTSHCTANEPIRCILPPSNTTSGHHFLYKSEVLRSNCTGLVTAVSYSDAQGPSLLLEALELDWWVPGRCGCAPRATCTQFNATKARREAFRCECPEGLQGDGFVDGAGCREVSKSKCDRSNYLSRDCGKIVLFGLIMAGIIFGAMVTGIGCVVCHVLKRRSASIRSQQSTKRLLSEADCTVPLYSYREIERATSGFSEDHRLGTGAYGTVYAGRLSDNRLVAVKRIKHRDNADGGLDSVMNEVKLVSSVSHRHLVRLLGCCIEQGQQILVYEFMPNGTLAQHLQRERGRPAVPWTVRLRVAAETAKAIAYLHSEVHPPIYHRDIKSSNILLDHEYNSKVADFGLSRMGMTSVDSSHISTAPQGTPGYVDPQYHQNFHLSDKSDVYSFGVVLVEIITAMKAVDFSRGPSEVNLAQLAVERIGRGCVDDIVDPFLDPHRDAWTLTSIHKVAELAFRCLAFHSEIRPSMAEVADELEQIQVSGWAPSADDAAFMSTTSSLCSSAPSRGTDKSLGPDKGRGEALPTSAPATAVAERETEKGAAGSSPVSVQERWFSDRSSPSSNSLLGNSSSLH
ncbi:wall-associated receptor kinase-like 14 [Triticum dicoccoides]|uniref:wall-associated receptor kinase-like 14 n=1 Tax=Triticum dicoccoides TaxID=85692 RepID=UPI000E7BA909|nr:wall-associated receptor kinase-like 14 [Triticum dicoccoides]